MRKLGTLVLVLAVLVTLIGCESVPKAEYRAFVDSMDRAEKILMPDLEGYYKADESLTPEQKERRMRLIEEHRNNIKTAKKAAE